MFLDMVVDEKVDKVVDGVSNVKYTITKIHKYANTKRIKDPTLHFTSHGHKILGYTRNSYNV